MALTNSNDMSLGEEKKSNVEVRNVDMTAAMQSKAISAGKAALDKCRLEKDIAAHIKKEFDSNYGPHWHCVVGRSFGSYVTHETNHFIYFYLDQIAVLLFRAG